MKCVDCGEKEAREEDELCQECWLDNSNTKDQKEHLLKRFNNIMSPVSTFLQVSRHPYMNIDRVKMMKEAEAAIKEYQELLENL